MIGAGMAGLTAARKLAEAGRHVLVLEARDRVGGRIRTLREQGEILELGAEFIHGHPEELWELIHEAGLRTYALDGKNLCHKNGKLKKCDEQGEVFKFLNGLEKWKGVDLAFADYPPLAKLPPEKQEEVINYVQSFNAADYRRIGVHALAVQQRAEEEIAGGEVFRVLDGYDRVPEFVANKVREAGGRIELSRTVEKIVWERGRVQVFVRDGGELAQYSAEQAVIALPLGVLQNLGVIFDPVPAALIAAKQLAMGPVRRFTLLFSERWWAAHDQKLSKLSFLFAHDAMPPVWWTAHPQETPTLTGWIGGPRSTAFDQFTREQVGDAACKELAQIFAAAGSDAARAAALLRDTRLADGSAQLRRLQLRASGRTGCSADDGDTGQTDALFCRGAHRHNGTLGYRARGHAIGTACSQSGAGCRARAVVGGKQNRAAKIEIPGKLILKCATSWLRIEISISPHSTTSFNER